MMSASSMLRSLVKHLISQAEIFNNQGRGVLWAAPPWQGESDHGRAMVVKFAGPSRHDLCMVIWATSSYPMIAVQWCGAGESLRHMSDLAFMSKHDASVDDSVNRVLDAAESLGMLFASVDFPVVDQQTKQYLSTLNYESLDEKKISEVLSKIPA